MNKIIDLLLKAKILDKDKIFNYNEIEEIENIENNISSKEKYIDEYKDETNLLTYRQLYDLKEDLKYEEERGFKKVIEVLNYYKIDYSRAIIL